MITDTKHRGRPGGRETRILVELMGNALAKEFVLKGGLAMRLAHGSERYTKDIDLDADPAFPKL
jgi:Nucleotidyl transferase AbiEii toxin, Type IV TA system